jgi:hypothetical protein
MALRLGIARKKDIACNKPCRGCEHAVLSSARPSGISKKSFNGFFHVKNRLKLAKTTKNPWKRWKPPITKNHYKFWLKPYWSDLVKNPKNIQKHPKCDNCDSGTITMRVIDQSF